jgi:tRNA threonylcarbamoyl adenosine modification protein YeaZ
MIGDLLRDVGIDLAAVDGFAVARGPGSFSGIRVGMATVKGMALVLGKPLIGVSSLEVLACQTLGEDETGVSLIDARRSEVYAAVYRNSSARLSLTDGPRLIHIDRIAETFEQAGPGAVLCGDPDLCRALARDRSVTIGSAEIPLAAACARIAWNRYQDGAESELHALAPLYIRPSDAEDKRARQSPRVQ